MANGTITLTKTQTQMLVQELMHLEDLKKTLLKIIPESALTYGSDLWWQKNELEAKEDVKYGRYTSFHTKKELQKHLDSLKGR